MHLFIRQQLNQSVPLRSLSLMLCTALSLGCASTKKDTSQAEASDATDASLGVDASEPIGPDSTRSPARVFLCADADLPTGVLEAFADAEFTRCAMPFGIVLAADDRMPEAYVQKAAQILAELMDKDMDGIADDEALASQLSQWSPRGSRCPGIPSDGKITSFRDYNGPWATISSFRVGGWKTARGQIRAFKSAP